MSGVIGLVEFNKVVENSIEICGNMCMFVDLLRGGGGYIRKVGKVEIA